MTKSLGEGAFFSLIQYKVDCNEGSAGRARRLQMRRVLGSEKEN